MSNHSKQNHSQSSQASNQQSAQIETLKEEVARLQRKIDQQPAAAPAPQEKLRRKVEEQQAARNLAEEDLKQGATLYQVFLPGNPQRLVGAVSSSEAWRKYKTFFGILDSQQSHQVAAFVS